MNPPSEQRTSSEELVKFAREGSLHLYKFIANDREALESVPESERA